MVPDEAEFVATRGSAKHLERLAILPRLEVVWAHTITPELLGVLARMSRLRAVYLCKAGKVDLSPLGELKSVEHVLVSWANHLSDLSWLSRLPRLRTLYLDDMKSLDLATLPELPGLEALHVGGGMTSALKLSSLGPLARLRNLRHLTLSNVRPRDGSLAPLHVLTGLRELFLPNFFEVEECARLAAALPETSGPVLTPFYTEPSRPAVGAPAFPCANCGGSRVMLTGRPGALLCPTCDAARIAKRVARWEAARSAFAPRVP